MLEFCELRIVENSAEFNTGDHETIILPLSGWCSLSIDGQRFELHGRENVFSAREVGAASLVDGDHGDHKFD